MHAIFATVDTPFEVWAYGSRVSGEAHEGSDLDLVMRSQNLQKLPLDLLLDLKRKIQQSNFPILVDLFDWARLPQSFHQNIVVQHEVFFTNIPRTQHTLHDGMDRYFEKHSFSFWWAYVVKFKRLEGNIEQAFDEIAKMPSWQRWRKQGCFVVIQQPSFQSLILKLV